MQDFVSLKNWKTENLVTVLYPGGFKPMTGGHIHLINKYLESDEVGKIKVLVGPAVRNGITQDVAVKIAKKLLERYENVIVEGVKWPSPILTAYKEIAEATPGFYTLASSSKGDDYKRVKDFVEKHNNGKYPPPEGVHVIELPVDIEPLYFRGRTDENNNTPISASVLRNDIINDDYENFKTGYPDNTEEEIRFVWEQLAGLVLNESLNREQFIQLNENLISNINESKLETINEGGGAGHMLSPWENLDLTFEDIKNIIKKSLTGKLENVSEKLDGANIMVTVRDGEVYLARSSKHLKNYGKEAIKWNEVKDSMHPKLQDKIKNAFQKALNDLQIILSKIDNINNIFLNGKRWLNIELINPDVENIIPYNTYQLRIHNISEVSEKGKIIKTITNDDILNKLIDNIKKIQKHNDLKYLYIISKTNSVQLKNIKVLNNELKKLYNNVNEFQRKYKLDNKNTIADYLAVRFGQYLTQNGIQDKTLRQHLINRWAYNIKVPNIINILKNYPDEIKTKVKLLDKNIDKVLSEYLEPIIILFSKLGIIVLKNLEGITVNNSGEAVDKIKRKAEDAINKIDTFVNNKELKSREDFEKKVEYLNTQLKRLEKAGGLNGIAPTEGIVFEYNGQLYKLTGIFLPLLKIINFFNFGKDK